MDTALVDFPTKLFLFFPYLRSDSRCKIRGLEFRSIDDRDGLDETTSKAVTDLSTMFFTQQGGRVTQQTFCVADVDDRESLYTRLQRVHEVQLLVSYIYSAFHPKPTAYDSYFLAAEDTILYSFLPDRMLVPSLVSVTKEDEKNGRVARLDGETTGDSDGFWEGYRGFCDGGNVWVAPGSKIQPLGHQVTLNDSQCLDRDVRTFSSSEANWSFCHMLQDAALPDQMFGRVFRSLLWHRRSCRRHLSEDERILNTAIALETLLNVAPGDKLTERFKTAVSTVVGPVERLEAWLDQFYDARSKVVHEGCPQDTVFRIHRSKRDKNPLPLRSLLVYARRVYQLCVRTIASGLMQSSQMSLPNLFVHNDERLEAMCEQLGGDGVSESKIVTLGPIIEALHEFETLSFSPIPEEPLDRLFGTAALLVSTYSEYLKSSSRSVPASVEEFVSLKKPSQTTALEGLQAIRGEIWDAVRVHGRGNEVDECFLRFIEFATRPNVPVAVHLQTDREST